MKKKEKGQPGYIKWRKEKYLIGTIAEFAVVIALVVLGYVQTKTKLNLLTVVAVVGCLPASKMLVEFITIAPHQSIEKDIYQEIEAKASLLKRVDDILLEINDKNYEFLLDIISEITLDKEKEELFSMFDIFLDNIENSYISKFKILYREIRKEIEISKKILKYNHSIL